MLRALTTLALDTGGDCGDDTARVQDQVTALVAAWCAHQHQHPIAVHCVGCANDGFRRDHVCELVATGGTSATGATACTPPPASRVRPETLLGVIAALSSAHLPIDANHFMYWLAPALRRDARQLATELRRSTTNRHSPLPPTPDVLALGAVAPPGHLWRGLRVNATTYHAMATWRLGSSVGDTTVVATTALHDRGLDYAARRRSSDPVTATHGVLFEIKAARALPIAAVSTWPVEQEWRLAGPFCVAAAPTPLAHAERQVLHVRVTAAAPLS